MGGSLNYEEGIILSTPGWLYAQPRLHVGMQKGRSSNSRLLDSYGGDCRTPHPGGRGSLGGREPGGFSRSELPGVQLVDPYDPRTKSQTEYASPGASQAASVSQQNRPTATRPSFMGGQHIQVVLQLALGRLHTSFGLGGGPSVSGAYPLATQTPRHYVDPPSGSIIYIIGAFGSRIGEFYLLDPTRILGICALYPLAKSALLPEASGTF